MYAVLVTDKKLGGTFAFGPYQRQPKAEEIAALCRNPQAIDYYDPEEYEVAVALLRKYGD
jgi:hypothetical protein